VLLRRDGDSIVQWGMSLSKGRESNGV